MKVLCVILLKHSIVNLDVVLSEKQRRLKINPDIELSLCKALVNQLDIQMAHMNTKSKPDTSVENSSDWFQILS